MDISKRLALVTMEDITLQDVKVPEPAKIKPRDLENMCMLPVGNVDNNSEIFIFSVTCSDSAKEMVNTIIPEIKKGKGFLLANFLRSDNDLNLWVRLAQVKIEYRLYLIAAMFQRAVVKGDLRRFDDVNRYFDKVMSNIPIGYINSSFNPQEAVLSSLTTTLYLSKVYNVTSTPQRLKIRS